MKQQTLDNLTGEEALHYVQTVNNLPESLAITLASKCETILQDLNSEIEELKEEIIDLGEQLEEMEEQDIKQNNCLLAIREELELEATDFDVINSLLKQAGY